MKWNKYRLKTITEAEDIVSSILMDLGVEGVEIEDLVPLTRQEQEQMYIDIMPEIETDDGIAWLTFYLSDDEKGLLSDIRCELEEVRAHMDIGECSIEVSQTEDVDWLNNWKQYFHQFHIDDVLVIPSWEDVDPEDEGKMIIHIDPGTAFGTGMHETTQLCIRQIRQYVSPNIRMLDVGCGSGILSMIGLKFGAGHAVGTDLDPAAIAATHENMARNDIGTDRYEVIAGNIIDDSEIQCQIGYEQYDLAAVNILAEVLVPLTPVVARHLKAGGIYITSGIIANKEELVRSVILKAGLTILDVTYQGEWVAITAKKE